MEYDHELRALKRAGRYRQRRLIDPEWIDLASNDYLAFAHDYALHERACARVGAYAYHAPKASLLVNGYHPIHATFEEALCEANGFEAGLLLGSGFAANVGVIEALVRKGDLLLIDAEFHASGLIGAKLCEGEVRRFAHNDPEDLEHHLRHAHHRRIIIAVEGIYSMGGDTLCKEIIELAHTYGAILFLDEAHSSGVIGEHLMGVLDHYNISPTPKIIKMGTLGKAYGSFGAYVLGSAHIIDYLTNRTKSAIYATAPSLYDIARAHEALITLQSHTLTLRSAITARHTLIRRYFPLSLDGLIIPIVIGDDHRVIELQADLQQRYGVHVGAIRRPTVERAIIRLIARLGVEEAILDEVCAYLQRFWVQ